MCCHLLDCQLCDGDHPLEDYVTTFWKPQVQKGIWGMCLTANQGWSLLGCAWLPLAIFGMLGGVWECPRFLALVSASISLLPTSEG